MQSLPNILNKAAIIIVLLMPMLMSCSGAAEREEKYLHSAEKYFKEENYKKAKVEIKNVLQINPKNSQARVLLGKLNQADHDYRSAYQNFKAALDEDSKQVDARLELAKIYLSAGKDVEAKKLVDEVLSIDPKVNEAKALSAGLLMKAGDRDAALVLATDVNSSAPDNYQAIAVLAALYVDTAPQLALDKIDTGIKLDPKGEALPNLKIEVLKRQQKTAEIDAIYLELIKMHPDNFTYYDKLGGSYVQQKRYDDAENIVRLAIKNNPDKTDPILALVQFTNGVRSTEKAVEVLQEFIKKKPDLYVLKQTLVNYYLQENKVSEAKDILNSVIDKGGKNSEALSARVDLAQIYLSQHEPNKTMGLLDDIFAIEPSNTDARILSARIKLSQNNIKDAIADLRAAIKNDSQSLVAFKLLAMAQEKDGSPELALDSYFRALEINNEDIASLFGAARLSIDNKNEEAGRKLLERILKLNPANLEANALLANLMVNKQEWDSAEKLCNNLIITETLANKATGLNLLGKVYSAQKKWDLAKQNYEKALDISPKSFDPVAGIVNAFLAENQVVNAAKTLEDYIKKYPDVKPARHLLADIYYKEKNIQGAIDIYQALISETPKDDNLYQNLATIYFEKKDIAKAESIYLDGLKANPESVSLHVYLGNFYTAIKRYIEAKNHYEIANAKMPNSDLIKNNLAILLVNQLSSVENTQKAMSLVSSFSLSKDPNYIDTLGWVHYSSGNIPQAISFLQQAVSMKESPEFRYHLGMAYKKGGQILDAKRELSLAVKEKNVNSDWLEPAKKALAEL